MPIEDRQFYQSIQDVLPGEQEVMYVSPETPVPEALDIMGEYNYSQLPVVEDGRVKGLFSYRSFSEQILDILSLTSDEESLTVEMFLETPQFRALERDPSEIFSDLDRRDAVLVGSRDALIGILTPMDVLQYLHGVAEPFILVAEIEHLIRTIMDACMTAEELEECAVRTLHERREFYENADAVPRKLTEMSMGEYVAIIEDGDAWGEHLGAAFSSSGNSLQQTLTKTRIDEARKLRNDVFHLKRLLTDDEIRDLRDTRSRLRERSESITSH